MRTLFIIILSFLFVNCYSQDTSKTKEENVFLVCEQLAQFPGGEKALREFIKTNLIYPEQARIDGIEGKVYAFFVIDEMGNIERIELKRKVHPLLDAEAIRIIKSMPKWEPARQRDYNVKFGVTIPITFKLDTDNR